MKTRMVEQRIGEYMGPIDWSYDFASHFQGCQESHRQASIDKAVAMLRTLEANPEKYEATTDGGWPRSGWHPVLRVGMYDGWPYWRPVPAVLLSGVLGPVWEHFYAITDIAEVKTGAYVTTENRETAADILARAVDLLRYAESQARDEDRPADVLAQIRLLTCDASELRNGLVVREGSNG